MRLARLCEVLEVLFQHGTTEGAMPGPPAAKPDVRGSHQPVRDVLADDLNAEHREHVGEKWIATMNSRRRERSAPPYVYDAPHRLCGTQS